MGNLLAYEDVGDILYDAGCPDEFVQQFLSAMKSGNIKDQFRLLKIQRCSQLEKVHLEEKHLDILDYLRYQIEKQERDETKRSD